MIALGAALLLASTPSFETVAKRASFPGSDTPLGMTDEMKLALNAQDSVVARFTYRTSYQKQGSVFEAWRDGKRIFQAMNDGKTVVVIANQARMVSRMPANPKSPLDIGTFRLRTNGKRFVTSWPSTAAGGLDGYKWKSTGDTQDFVEGVACRRLSYAGEKADADSLKVDIWLRKGTDRLEYIRMGSDEANMTCDPNRYRGTIAMPRGPLARAPFPGLDSVPMSVVRKKADALWANMGEE